MDHAAALSQDSRIASLDVARGIAVLGILLMNIVGMGLPFAYDDPTVAGGATGLNLLAWRINAVFFEGTMRGLFTILFGASALLFTFRALARDPHGSPAHAYFRRMILLMIFGLVNGYVFLWDGDILFLYGLIGMLLYPLRHLSPKQLLTLAVVVLVLQTGVSLHEHRSYRELMTNAVEAQATEERGEELTDQEREAIAAWEEERGYFKPDPSQIDFAVEAMRGGYASAFEYMRDRVWYSHTTGLVEFGIGDALMMMLLGMALFKLGVLSGRAETRTYVTMCFVGYAAGLCINLYELILLERNDFSITALMRSFLTYDYGRIPMTLGHLALILLFCRSNVLPNLQARFAAVGKMALTNYLSHSVIGLFLFTGAGLALYNQLERHQLYYFVVAIWIFQLWWSPLWLKRHRYGPLEWLWRKGAYGRKVM
jgi:uncharacterized protein